MCSLIFTMYFMINLIWRNPLCAILMWIAFLSNDINISRKDMNLFFQPYHALWFHLSMYFNAPEGHLSIICAISLSSLWLKSTHGRLTGSKTPLLMVDNTSSNIFLFFTLFFLYKIHFFRLWENGAFAYASGIQKICSWIIDFSYCNFDG